MVIAAVMAVPQRGGYKEPARNQPSAGFDSGFNGPQVGRGQQQGGYGRQNQGYGQQNRYQNRRN